MTCLITLTIFNIVLGGCAFILSSHGEITESDDMDQVDLANLERVRREARNRVHEGPREPANPAPVCAICASPMVRGARVAGRLRADAAVRFPHVVAGQCNEPLCVGCLRTVAKDQLARFVRDAVFDPAGRFTFRLVCPWCRLEGHFHATILNNVQPHGNHGGPGINDPLYPIGIAMVMSAQGVPVGLARRFEAERYHGGRVRISFTTDVRWPVWIPAAEPAAPPPEPVAPVVAPAGDNPGPGVPRAPEPPGGDDASTASGISHRSVHVYGPPMMPLVDGDPLETYPARVDAEDEEDGHSVLSVENIDTYNLALVERFGVEFVNDGGHAAGARAGVITYPVFITAGRRMSWKPMFIQTLLWSSVVLDAGASIAIGGVVGSILTNISMVMSGAATVHAVGVCGTQALNQTQTVIGNVIPSMGRFEDYPAYQMTDVDSVSHVWRMLRGVGHRLGLSVFIDSGVDDGFFQLWLRECQFHSYQMVPVSLHLLWRTVRHFAGGMVTDSQYRTVVHYVMNQPYSRYFTNTILYATAAAAYQHLSFYQHLRMFHGAGTPTIPRYNFS